MTERTPLDRAQIAMDATPDDRVARMRFYQQLADSELFMLLKSEAVGDQISPDIFTVDGQDYVLVFDLEERLAIFVDGAAHHGVVSGRMLAAMLVGQGVGLGLNLGSDASTLIPEGAIDWLVQALDNAPKETRGLPEMICAPKGFSQELLAALDAKLASAAGLATSAYLVSVRYADQRGGFMLAIIDALPAAQSALTNAVNEAYAFCGQSDAALDVAFFASSDAIFQQLQQVGLRFDLPVPTSSAKPPSAPGRDPDKPPILR